MKYAGRLGEFKWWGFLIAIGVCLAFAMFIFKRFTYVQETRTEAMNAAAERQMPQLENLNRELSRVKQRLAIAECKIAALEIDKKVPKADLDTRCAAAGGE